MWRSKYTARDYEEPHSDEGCFAATVNSTRHPHALGNVSRQSRSWTRSFVADYTQAFLNVEVREGEQLYAQPPEGWNPKILTDDRRVVCA